MYDHVIQQATFRYSNYPRVLIWWPSASDYGFGVGQQTQNGTHPLLSSCFCLEAFEGTAPNTYVRLVFLSASGDISFAFVAARFPVFSCVAPPCQAAHVVTWPIFFTLLVKSLEMPCYLANS